MRGEGEVRKRQWSSPQPHSAVVCSPVLRWQLATIICQLISLGLIRDIKDNMHFSLANPGDSPYVGNPHLITVSLKAY